MKIKKTLSLFLIGITTLFLSGSAFAEILSLSVGLPVYRSFSDLTIEYDNSTSEATELEADGMPSGALFHVNIPFFPGLGYENYEVKLKKKSGTDVADDMKLQTVLYDIFYLLPIPVINLTIGGGVGNAKIITADEDSKSGLITQYFVQAGIPILPAFDIHVSYHAVNGKVEFDGADDIDISGNTAAIGVAFVF